MRRRLWNNLTNKQKKQFIYQCWIKKWRYCLYREVESLGSIRLVSSIGSRNYIHSTANGKCLVSGLSSDKIKELVNIKGLIAVTNSTITDIDAFLAEIEKVKRLGYAIDDSENEVGVRCIAALILDYTKTIVGAISISGVESTMQLELMHNTYSGAIKQAALEISHSLGCRET